MEYILYYTIYETINLINGMKYIGKHITDNLDDDYIGSGVYLKRAIKKYGKENFIKKILFVYTSEDDMNNKEIELVNEKLVENHSYYNLAYGGQGGQIILTKNHPLYEETCRKISESKLKTFKQISETVKLLHKQKKVGMYGKKQSEHQKETVSLFLTGKKQTDEHIKNHKESLKRKFSDPNYIHPNKGKKKKTKECVYCKREIDSGNYARYHGDNCKTKN